MGLDGVELIVSIEQAFGVQIPDAVAAGLITPGHVIDYIDRLQSTDGNAPSCLSQRAFHCLRSAFVSEGLCTRQEFQPGADLNTMLYKARRRQIWATFKQRYDLTLPGLQRPRALLWAITIIVLGASGWLAFHLGDTWNERLGLFSTFVIPLGLLSMWLTMPFAVCFSSKPATPAGVVEYLTIHHPKRFMRDHEPLTREQIAATVKALTLQYCREADYRENARFIQDLGFD